MESSQSVNVYIQKIRHNGLKWTINRIIKEFATRVFKYYDNTLILYKVDLKFMSGIKVDSKLTDVTYDWVPESDIDKILSLQFIDFSREKVEEYFKNKSKCFGAFLNDRLIAASFIHFGEYNFPFYQYCLKLEDNEVYDGPDYVLPEFRGNNLQPAVLSRIAANLYKDNYKTGYGSVVKDNLASQKGVAKAGPKQWREVRVVKLHKFLLHRKVTNL